MYFFLNSVKLSGLRWREAEEIRKWNRTRYCGVINCLQLNYVMLAPRQTGLFSCAVRRSFTRHGTFSLWRWRGGSVLFTFFRSIMKYDIAVIFQTDFVVRFRGGRLRFRWIGRFLLGFSWFQLFGIGNYLELSVVLQFLPTDSTNVKQINSWKTTQLTCALWRCSNCTLGENPRIANDFHRQFWSPSLV